ncbi:MAG: GTP 3',8-cyclase MoaA [Phycisphaerales bacterium]|nr:GTP 3',8-cyclase MoaA [Phycisphaerales bacterium]
MARCNYLRISVTDRCNLRCRYCMPPDGVQLLAHSDLLDYAEIEELVHAAVRWGVRKVRISGGEPLLRRDIEHLIANLGRIAGLEQLALTTNATRLRRLAPALKQAGVTAINISMDSLQPDRFARITRGGDLDAVIDGVDAAIEAGIERIKLNAVVLRGINGDELLDFVRFACDRSVTVRFIELMPFVPGSPLTGALLPVSEMRACIEAAHQLEPVQRDNLAGPACEFIVDGGPARIGFISGVTETFCDNCNRLRLTSDGNLLPCLAGNSFVPMRDILRQPHTEGDLIAAFDRAVAMKATCDGCYQSLSMSQIGG